MTEINPISDVNFLDLNYPVENMRIEENKSDAVEVKRPYFNKSAFRKFTNDNIAYQTFAPESKERVYVGELHEKWQFPSDHLPIGAAVGDTNIISWNVLNNAYMSWVYKNSQGLTDSMITDQDVVVKDNGLTQRDLTMVKYILEMVEKNNSLICLQECSAEFIAELQETLPENMEIVLSFDTKVKDQEVVIYNKDEFSFIEKIIDLDGYPSTQGKLLMTVALEKNGITYRVFNSHVPGDPNLPGRYEFAQYVKNHQQKGEITIALGDLNFDQYEMDDAFKVAAGDQESTFTRITPYQTNVGLDMYSKAIDHFFIDCWDHPMMVYERKASEILDNLQELRELLQEKYPQVMPVQ